jgi:hypothetical protein
MNSLRDKLSCDGNAKYITSEQWILMRDRAAGIGEYTDCRFTPNNKITTAR